MADRAAGFAIMIKKDGNIKLCTNVYQMNRSTVYEFESTKSMLCFPHLFESEDAAQRCAKSWQRAYPADASGWYVEIIEYEF